MESDLASLQDWLVGECERRNLSWREASLGAGLNPGAVSAVMTGIRPGLQICVSLAEYFSVPPEFVLRLAGHLPPKASDDHIPPEQRARIDHIISMWREVAQLHPDSLGVLLNVVEGQAQMAITLLEAGRRLEFSEEEAPQFRS